MYAKISLSVLLLQSTKLCSGGAQQKSILYFYIRVETDAIHDQFFYTLTTSAASREATGMTEDSPAKLLMPTSQALQKQLLQRMRPQREGEGLLLLSMKWRTMLERATELGSRSSAGSTRTVLLESIGRILVATDGKSPHPSIAPRRGSEFEQGREGGRWAWAVVSGLRAIGEVTCVTLLTCHSLMANLIYRFVGTESLFTRYNNPTTLPWASTQFR